MSKSLDFLQSGREVIQAEQKAISLMLQRLDASFTACCERMLECTGRVVVLGMGKSGHIAKKIAATFASTGTPSFYVHPAEAGHGDLGMLTHNDIVLAISYSGETEELINLLPLIRLFQLPLIAMTGNPKSTLAKSASHVLNVAVDEEACPLGLAPTASTTATLVMGDAIAITLLRARGFNADDFARFHPSGALGKRLLMRVDDLMHQKEDIPKTSPTASIAAALIEMTNKRLGMTTIVDENNNLLGIFTDGDLRRAIDNGMDVRATKVESVMTPSCTKIPPTMLASEALNIMRSKKITSLPIIDDKNIPIGIIHMHDLLRAGVA